MAIIGPAIGYLIGGEFLKRYTDFSVDVSRSVLIGSRDPPGFSHWIRRVGLEIV